MISGLPVIRVVLLAATFVGVALLVAATATTSAGSGGHQGAPRSPAAGAREGQELAAAAAEVGEERRAQVRGANLEPPEVDKFRAVSLERIQPLASVGRLQARTSGNSKPRQQQQRHAQAEVEEADQFRKQPPTKESESNLLQQQLAAAAVVQQAANSASHHDHHPRGPVYTNQFVIQVQGGELEARKLAEKHGFVYLNHILGDYYHLEHRRVLKRSTSLHQEALNISIQDEPQVSSIFN